jgi:hypothetical protein
MRYLPGGAECVYKRYTTLNSSEAESAKHRKLLVRAGALRLGPAWPHPCDRLPPCRLQQEMRALNTDEFRRLGVKATAQAKIEDRRQRQAPPSRRKPPCSRPLCIQRP